MKITQKLLLEQNVAVYLLANMSHQAHIILVLQALQFQMQFKMLVLACINIYDFQLGTNYLQNCFSNRTDLYTILYLSLVKLLVVPHFIEVRGSDATRHSFLLVALVIGLGPVLRN